MREELDIINKSDKLSEFIKEFEHIKQIVLNPNDFYSVLLFVNSIGGIDCFDNDCKPPEKFRFLSRDIIICLDNNFESEFGRWLNKKK